jgi:hypothetical protein
MLLNKLQILLQQLQPVQIQVMEELLQMVVPQIQVQQPLQLHHRLLREILAYQFRISLKNLSKQAQLSLNMKPYLIASIFVV